ncbi:MAG: 2-oxoacid:acceptor oxidoreductase [Nitrospirae bacterium]|nr:MAG: 2-oxoacid:acceptor oxidoreductase [Nitrospirota bacterium]
MIQVRVHGRGGQGIVTAAELLSMAAFYDGKYAQAFPTFGSERMGAPVTAFCRIDDKPIRSREPISEPDVVLIQDPTLLHQVDVFGGLNPKGLVLINTARTLEELGLAELCAQHPQMRMYTLPASDIALKHLGRPLANAAMVAGFAAVTGVISRQAVEQAIARRFPGRLGELNAAVADEAFDWMAAAKEEMAGRSS